MFCIISKLIPQVKLFNKIAANNIQLKVLIKTFSILDQNWTWIHIKVMWVRVTALVYDKGFKQVTV